MPSRLIRSLVNFQNAPLPVLSSCDEKMDNISDCMSIDCIAPVKAINVCGLAKAKAKAPCRTVKK